MTWMPYAGLALGVIGRVIIPWLIEKLADDTITWNWRIVAPQLLTGALAFLGLVAANPALGQMPWPAALALGLGSAAAGWGVASIGRTTQKARGLSRK